MLARKVVRDLTLRRLRSLLTAVGVALGVAGFVAIVTTIQGFTAAQQALFDAGRRPQIEMFLYDAPPALIRSIERVEGVARAELRTNTITSGQLAPALSWRELNLLGIDGFQDQQLDRLVLVEGEWPQGDEVLVEPAIAAAYALGVGDSILLRDASNRMFGLRVSGIARLPAALSAQLTNLPRLFVPVAVTQRVTGVAGYNQLLIGLAPDAVATEVADDVSAELSRRAIPQGPPRFNSPDNYVGKRELDALFTMLLLFSGLAVLLGGVIAGNTLAALVSESYQEIAILKTLGATRAQVLGSILFAALLYGVAGTLAGLGLGTAGGVALLKGLGGLASLDPSLRLDPLALGLGSMIGLVTPLVGGALPAWRATMLPPKEALDSHGVSRHFGRDRVDRLLQRLPGLPPLAAMSVRNLLRRKGRSLITLVVVALAVSALLAARATERSVNDAIDAIFDTYRADAYLQFSGPVSARDAGLLRRTEGTTHAEPWLLRRCGVGFSPATCWALPADSPFYDPTLLAGSWLSEADPLGAVLSDDVAAVEGLGIGDRFSLRYRERQRELTVRGIVRDNAIFLGSTVQAKLFLPRATFADLTGTEDAADLFALQLSARGLEAQQAQLAEVSRRLAPWRPSSTLALSEIEAAREQTRILTTALRGVVALIALVGAAGLLNTLALNVLERRREIGVLRAIGSDDWQLGRLFLGEGLGLGLGGWLIGLPTGWLIGALFVGILSRTLFPIPFIFPLRLLGVSVLFALLLALLASVAPALAAARLPVREALRYE